MTPEDLTPAEREQAQAQIVRIYLYRNSVQYGERKTDKASRMFAAVMRSRRRSEFRRPDALKHSS